MFSAAKYIQLLYSNKQYIIITFIFIFTVNYLHFINTDILNNSNFDLLQLNNQTCKLLPQVQNQT